MDKQILNLKKQNEGMEIAFKNKNIEFTKLIIDNSDMETEINQLKEYNNYLKGISLANRPPPTEKKQEAPKQKQEAPPPIKEVEDDEEDDVPK